MFDIKKFLTENKVTINEDTKFTQLEKVFMWEKKKVRETFEQYTQFPDPVSIRNLRVQMRQFEEAAKAVEKYKKSLPRRPKVPNPRNRLS